MRLIAERLVSRLEDSDVKIDLNPIARVSGRSPRRSRDSPNASPTEKAASGEAGEQHSSASGSTYMDKELINQKLKPLPPPTACFHIYCSPLNLGALEIMQEVARERGFECRTEDAPDAPKTPTLLLTSDVAKLDASDHMLLYLTSQTWTRGEASEALGKELMQAMDLKVNVLLVHEMPGVGGQEARFGCEFGTFFSCADGATPGELLKRGVYSSIAVPLKGGEWRKASMVQLAMALGMSKEDIELAKEGGDVLGLEAEVSTIRASFRLSKSLLSQVPHASMRNLMPRPALRRLRPAKKTVIASSVSTTYLVSTQPGGPLPGLLQQRHGTDKKNCVLQSVTAFSTILHKRN